MNLLCRCLRYLSSKAFVVCYSITLYTLIYSLYSQGYSLYTFYWAITCAGWVFSAITGISPGFIGSINVFYTNVLYVLLSKTIAKYLYLPPLYVVSVEAVLTATSLCIFWIFSYISSPSYLGNSVCNKYSIYCSTIHSIIFVVDAYFYLLYIAYIHIEY